MINVMKNRFLAFLTHLAFSAVVAAPAMILVFFVWYPAPLHTAVGVTQIFLMLLAIDIIIGPVITFIIYNPNKLSLEFDLTVIALLQLTALCYGMNAVFEGRPAFVVFNADRFSITRALDIDSTSAGTARKSGNLSANTSWLQPKWVAAVASPNSERSQEILFSSLQGGPDWPQLPELFVPLTQVKKQILEKAKPIKELRLLHSQNAHVMEVLAHWKDGQVKWLPLRSKVKDMTVLIDANSSAVIEILDINPWP